MLKEKCETKSLKQIVPNGPKWSQMFSIHLKRFQSFKCSKWFQLALMSIMTRICVLVMIGRTLKTKKYGVKM